MDNEYLKRIYGLLESGATLGTGAVSGLVGMPYGLYKGVTSGAYGTPQAPKIAAREAQQFMERNTYQPRTAEGQANLQQLAGLLEASKLPPVMPEASLLAAIPKQSYAAQAERAGMAAEKAIAPVVTRTMERGGMPAQLLSDLAQGSRRQIFIGEKAKAWDKPAAELAKQLEDKGLSPKEIWQQTGTARGVDGKWRQEISDAEALLTNKQKNLDGKLHESLQHPSLYENYPALQYYDAEIQSEIALPEHLKKALVGKGKGSFTEKDFVTDEPKITAQAFSNEDKGTLLHEIQHAVQSREGFARGGSPEAEFLSRGNITGDVLSPEAQLIYENKGVSKDQAAMEAYRRLAGEAEARLTADRALLTPEQRLQYFPFEERSFPNPYIEKTTDFNAYGLDVNPKDLIVRQGGLLGQPKAASATSLSDIENKFKDIALDVYEKNGTINLSRIVVPKEMRSSGIGSSAMSDLTSYADQTGQKMALTPSGDFGGNVKRLKEFYKQFGFVENKGKNKDFSTMETMIRLPEIPKEPKELTNLLD